jgi:endonuclease YncB( thermonuclease family)
MKKNLIWVLFIFLFIISPVLAEQKYKVIKIIDGDTIYVDFNNNGIPEQDEKVRLNGIDTFETKLNEGLKWQMKNNSFTQDEALGLGYYGKEFAKKQLLNKYVTATNTADTKTDNHNRQLMSVYYDNGKNYEQEVLKAGLATVYKKSNIAQDLYKYENPAKIKANAQKTHHLHLVLLNKKTGKYHKITCEYGQMATDVELINKPLIKYAPANCCYIIKHKDIEKPIPDIHTDFIDIFINRH